MMTISSTDSLSITSLLAVSACPAASGVAGVRAGAGESWAYTLADLQAYLGQFPAAHYSHGGREPLLYCTVLLLSLQFRAAVAFLAQDASARDYRVDAPHLAIALTHHQVTCPTPITRLRRHV